MMGELGPLAPLVAEHCAHPHGGRSDSQGRPCRRLQDRPPVSREWELLPRSWRPGGLTSAALTQPRGCAHETGSYVPSSSRVTFLCSC